jgi:Single Cache domain 2
MNKHTLASMILVANLAMAQSALSQTSAFGTPADAKALLEKAVAAVKMDKAKALAMFSSGEGGFKDRDLYVACASDDGTTTSHIDPKRIGMNRNTMKDVTGKGYGEEMQRVAAEGKIAEVAYVFPRPGEDKTPVAKVAFVTKVADQTCFVGYYK